MKSNPERSKASTKARLFIVDILASSPLISKAPIVDFETPETRASSVCSNPRSARAARHKRGVKRMIVKAVSEMQQELTFRSDVCIWDTLWHPKYRLERCVEITPRQWTGVRLSEGRMQESSWAGMMKQCSDSGARNAAKLSPRISLPTSWS